MKPGFVRIISGTLRGRRIKVADVTDLRPTPDRVRETLFNWLAPKLPGSYCLDLFAGTGILGFESVSRGAAYVEMVDSSPIVVEMIKNQIKEFRLENVVVKQANVTQQLSKPQKTFDIVYLDPPYQANLLPTVCQFLEQHQFLSRDAYIYLEAKEVIKDNVLPANWKLIKSQRAGQVYYHLAVRQDD